MVVCRFFLKGTCRFGERCRYEHPRNSADFNRGNNYSSQSQWQHDGGYGGQGYNRPAGGNYTYYRGQDSGPRQSSGFQQSSGQGQFRGSFQTQNRFAVLGDNQSNPNRTGPSGSMSFGGDNLEPQTGEILDSIKKDAEEWDVGGMWPYSSYRPTKSRVDLPGFQDLSPEELRLAAYAAEKGNRFEIYKSAESNSALSLKKKREMLKNPSRDLQTFLIENYRGQYKQSTFGNKPVFGGHDTSTFEIFSNSGCELFPGMSSSGGFSSSSPPSGLFSSGAGGASDKSVAFGSGFGIASVSPSAPPKGLFSSGSETTSSAFGGPSSGFGNSGDSSIGRPTEPQTTGLFGKPAQQGTGLFGKPAQPPSGLFGQQSTTPGTGLFGKQVGPTQDISNVDSKHYTPINVLTAEEREQFEAAAFTLGKIPTRPPPMELINTIKAGA